MIYVLKGNISRTQPYQLDKTLTLEGAGAEAKATGEAIYAVRKEAKTHAEDTANPHKVSKEQVGLSEVDNTSDMDKPVSTAQEQAIAEAKKAGTDAFAYAEEVMGAANNAQTSADEAKTTADNAQTTADEAKNAAQNAQATADSKAAWFSQTAILYRVDWDGKRRTIDVPGVTENLDQPIFIIPDDNSEESYSFFKVKPKVQGVDTVTFSCEEVPDDDILLRIVGFTLPKEV